jgi:Flp pilus assembly protein TadG
MGKRRPEQGKKAGMMKDRRGMAAVEFALIAPALIFLVIGVMEMAFRFRAKEEAVRYVHQVADLISRENNLTTAQLKQIYDASIYMMKPLETTSRLDLDVSSVGYGAAPALTPSIMWRRVSGTAVPFTVTDTNGMGGANETVIRVGVRYRYTSPISSLFGGANMSIEEEAISRPREQRVIPVDSHTNENGVITYF